VAGARLGESNRVAGANGTDCGGGPVASVVVDSFNGLEIPETLEDALDPATLALLVYDMQVGVLAQIDDADRVLRNVLALLDAARGAGVRTVFLRHYFMPTALQGVYQLRQAKVWQRKDRAADTSPLIPHGSPGFALAPELEPRESEPVLDKITMSAFEGTPLDIVLRDCGVRAFAIAGVALEVGIEPTVRHAADLGYIPVVVRDACGAGNAEAAARSLETLAFAGDAMLASTAEVCAALSASGRT
jgi:nicotinamidase-related amidase